MAIWIIAGVLLVCIGLYATWQPEQVFRDGRHNLGRNGIWLSHGWLGDDRWFISNRRDPQAFRSQLRLEELQKELKALSVIDLYPHLTPTDQNGAIPQLDAVQTKRFLTVFQGYRVLPWIGGRADKPKQTDLENPVWRKNFVSSIEKLLTTYPSFAGVHLNIEPWRNNNQTMLELLKSIKKNMPEGKILSVATIMPRWIDWLPDPWTWDEAYYKKVAKEVDQIVPMLYDTTIMDRKYFVAMMSKWINQIHTWSAPKSVLIGVAAYPSTALHQKHIENIQNATQAINAAFMQNRPANYQGIAIYAHWTLEPQDRGQLDEFLGRTTK